MDDIRMSLFVPMYYRRYMDDIRMSLLYLCIIGDIWMISGCHVCTYVL